MVEVGKKKDCPFCSKIIPSESTKCSFCQSMIVQSSVDSSDFYTPQNDLAQTKKKYNKFQLQDTVNNTNKSYPKISIALGIVGAVLLSVPILSFISTGSGLFFGVKGLKSQSKRIAIVGIVICSLFLFSSFILVVSQLNESASMIFLRSHESSLNAQINDLREERLLIERERTTIQRLINEHERINSKSTISDSDRRRLLDVSNDLLRHSRYINYRIDSSGILISPSIDSDLNERIKEIRLQELLLERELAPIELQITIDEMD